MANLLSNVLPRWPVAALCLPETFKVIPWELSRPKNSTYCIRCIEVEDYANSVHIFQGLCITQKFATVHSIQYLARMFGLVVFTIWRIRTTASVLEIKVGLKIGII